MNEENTPDAPGLAVERMGLEHNTMLALRRRGLLTSEDVRRFAAERDLQDIRGVGPAGADEIRLALRRIESGGAGAEGDWRRQAAEIVRSGGHAVLVARKFGISQSVMNEILDEYQARTWDDRSIEARRRPKPMPRPPLPPLEACPLEFTGLSVPTRRALKLNGAATLADVISGSYVLDGRQGEEIARLAAEFEETTRRNQDRSGDTPFSVLDMRLLAWQMSAARVLADVNRRFGFRAHSPLPYRVRIFQAWFKDGRAEMVEHVIPRPGTASTRERFMLACLALKELQKPFRHGELGPLLRRLEEQGPAVEEETLATLAELPVSALGVPRRLEKLLQRFMFESVGQLLGAVDMEAFRSAAAPLAGGVLLVERVEEIRVRAALAVDRWGTELGSAALPRPPEVEQITRGFAVWLRGALQESGISQSLLARRVGVSPQQVARWRLGKAEPTRERLLLIEDELGRKCPPRLRPKRAPRKTPPPVQIHVGPLLPLEMRNVPVRRLLLSPQTQRTLWYAGIHTAQDLVDASEERLGELRGVGPRRLREILEVRAALIAGGAPVDEPEPEPPPSEESPEPPVVLPPGTADLPLEYLALSTRTRNCLLRMGVGTAQELVSVAADEFSLQPQVGPAVVREFLEVREALIEGNPPLADGD